nr:ORF2 [Torque teno felis virus]
MNPEEERRKLHCAIWLQSCARTHRLWCDCGIWTSHVKGWRPTEGEDVGGVTGDVGDGREVRINEFGDLIDPDVKEDDER